MKTSRWWQVLSIVLALGVPAGVSASWTPIRLQEPNVDLALLLLVTIVAIGALGSRLGVLVAAVSSALWFEFFATYPYEHFLIERLPDIETTIGLAVVGVVVGELARRVMEHRDSARDELEGVSVVQGATELVASGQDLVRVIEAVASDLTHVLSLTSCYFEVDPRPSARARITRDGEQIGQKAWALFGSESPLEFELPVIVEGERMGQFVCRFEEHQYPDKPALRVAVTLAGTVATAFLAHAPPPTPPDKAPRARLRVLQSGHQPKQPRLNDSQETSGLSSLVATKRS